jgi:hypothetical protein
LKNRRTAEFRAQFERLPHDIQAIARDKFQLFLSNPYHPSLRNHPLPDKGRGRHRQGSRSVTIVMSYRAVYVIDGDVNLWYWVGSHADYDAYFGGT